MNYFLIFFALPFIMYGQSIQKPSLPYYKNTCNDFLEKIPTPQLITMLKSEPVLAFTYCKKSLIFHNINSDIIQYFRNQVHKELNKKTLIQKKKKNNYIKTHYKKRKMLYRKYGGDLNNIYRSQELLKDIIHIPEALQKDIEFYYGQYHSDILSNSLGRDSWKRPIKAKNVFKNIVNSIEHIKKTKSIFPKHTHFHEYSDQFKNLAKKNKWRLPFKKLTVSLMTATTSIFLPTGHEKKLKNWLMKQKEESVHFISLFEKSYLLNNGHLYYSLLTINNVLSKDWLALDRNNLPWIKALKNFTLQKSGEGDKFGAWYHLWGAILFGYYKPHLAPIIMIGEVIISLLDPNNPFASDIQESYVNFAGAKIGKLLRTKLPIN